MRASFKAFVAGLALAVAFSVCADQFPSKPTFQALTVNSGGSTVLQVSGTSITAPGASSVPWTAAGAVGSVRAFYQAGATRISTTTQTCDAALTVSNLPNGWYYVRAMLDFSGGGITANGWKASLSGTNVASYQQLASQNANNTAYTAPVQTIVSATGGGALNAPVTGTFANAGADTLVILDAVVDVFNASNTLCVGWAQFASNATGTTLNNSIMTITRVN